MSLTSPIGTYLACAGVCVCVCVFKPVCASNLSECAELFGSNKKEYMYFLQVMYDGPE